MTARIYQPAKTATQSGIKGTEIWVLEFIPTSATFIEPIMGWIGSYETLPTQVKLHFSTQEKAIAYAERNKIDYQIIKPQKRKMKIKSYIDNFKPRS